MFLTALALASPLTVDPTQVDWLPGIWASVAPDPTDNPAMPQKTGSVLTVMSGDRFTGRRKTRVFQISQWQGSTHPGPRQVLEEIWYEPDGAYLQVWMGTGGEPVRLALTQASENALVFEGPKGVFPTKVAYGRTADGVSVVREGTFEGAPLASDWRYVPRPPLERVRTPR